MQKVVILMIQLYQKILSPALPKACRFYPSCSQYTLEAVQRFGIVIGVGLGILRIGKCHPFHRGGFDPVPTGVRG